MHAFEARFAATFGPEFHAFAFWKGRIALYAILLALDLQDGDEVVLPGYTCVVVPNAVRYAGARPIYADIIPDGYNLDPISVEQRITPRTRALIVQHTYGIPADVTALSALAAKHQLSMIEDCAHVLPGSRFHGQPLGALGRAAFFSFQWSKPYTTGLGGMVLTQDEKLAQRLRVVQESFKDPPHLRRLQLQVQYALYQRLFRPNLYWLSRRCLHLLSSVGLLVGSSSEAELIGQPPADLRWRMSEAQKNWGLARMQGSAQNAAHRRQLTRYYSDALRQHGWPVLEGHEVEDAILLRYPVRVKAKAALLERARRSRVELGTWFETPLHPLPISHHHLVAYRVGTCPIAETTAASVINLPLHDRVGQADAERILQFIIHHAATRDKVDLGTAPAPGRSVIQVPRESDDDQKRIKGH
jgi:dTDP-4-amino-4,6-dideoxygalactose transaminase